MNDEIRATNQTITLPLKIFAVVAWVIGGALTGGVGTLIVGRADDFADTHRVGIVEQRVDTLDGRITSAFHEINALSLKCDASVRAYSERADSERRTLSGETRDSKKDISYIIERSRLRCTA